MKLAIIGGTGFLGKCFLEEYGPTFSQINVLTRSGISSPKAPAGTLRIVKGTLGNRNAIETLLRGMDVLVHAGFDHNYAENISGITHIIEALINQENTIKRVIYLSSYVVYDRKEKIITEQSAPSGYGDIYTREKQLIETLIRQSAGPVQFIILQPTIVLGSGGNWSKVLIEAAHSEVVKLSNGGTTTCNLVHVNDVAQAIERAVHVSSEKIPNRVTSFLITGGQAPWKDVLMIHGPKQQKGDVSVNIETRMEGTFDGKYGNSFLQNLIIGTIYAPLFRAFTHPIMKLMKRRMERSKSSEKKSSHGVQYSFQGLSKAIQQVDHQAKSKKAQDILGYTPTYTLSKIAASMRFLIEAQKRNSAHKE